MADLIDAIRGELEESAYRARKKDLQFEVQEVNLDVEITTTGTRAGKGGLKVWVFTLGASASKSDANAHKVSLKLNPVNRDGTRFVVSNLTATPVREE